MKSDDHEFGPEPLPGFEAEPVPKKAPLQWWICILIGIAAGFVGLLPWLITGLHLPLQEYWAQPAAEEAMPIVLLPFSYYAVIVLFGLIVTGSAVAGVSTRATEHLQRRGGAFWIALGLLAVQVFAVAQTALVLRDGLQHRSLAWIYLAAMLGVVVVSIMIGVLVLLLIADAPRAGATIGISLASVAVAAWLWAFTYHVVRPTGGIPDFDTGILQWAPPVIVGIGLAWGGLNTVGRILAAPLCLAILWALPTALIAAGTAAGHPQLLDLPDEIWERAIDEIIAGLTVPERAIPPILVALVVAAGGLLVRWLWRRGRAGSQAKPEPEPEPKPESEPEPEPESEAEPQSAAEPEK